MPQDAVTLSRTALELNDLFSGAKINKITQPSQDEIILFLYSKFGNARLTVCVNAVGARVGITELERSNPATPPAFCMLLRKHLLNSTIKSIAAVRDERIVRIAFDGKNDFMEPVEKQLYCEIMGKYSNAVFCENETICGTLKPGVFDLGKERVLLPGAKYALPHSQGKTSVFDEKESVELLKNFRGGNLADFIFKNVVGFSAQTAKEAVFRYYKFVSTEKPLPDPEKFREFLIEFVSGGENKPCVLTADGKPTDYFFCDYTTISGEKIFFEHITDAETYLFDEKKRLRDLAELKNKLLSVVNSVLKKEKKKLAIVNDKILSCKDSETTRRYGELVTANIYKIKRGDKSVTVEDYYNENAPLTIKLDEQLSPNQNAQKFFKKYTKLKNTLKAVVPQKEQAESEIEYAESVLAEIEAAEDLPSLGYVRDELIESGYIPQPKNETKKKNDEKTKSEYRNFEYGGFHIRAGKNNVQNDRLTFTAKPSDCWLHVKDYHSAHVVIESNGKHIPTEIIGIAAEICAYFSEAKQGSKVAVDYTLKKYVKKPPKAKYGSVIYTDFKTVYVTPDSHSNIEVKK